MTLTAQIVPQLRMRGAIPRFPQMTPCCTQHIYSCTFTLSFPYPCLLGLSGCLFLKITPVCSHFLFPHAQFTFRSLNMATSYCVLNVDITIVRASSVERLRGWRAGIQFQAAVLFCLLHLVQTVLPLSSLLTQRVPGAIA